LLKRFDDDWGEVYRLMSYHTDDESDSLVYPAYDYLLSCSHTFNLLHARGALSVAQRQGYIDKIRMAATALAQVYVKQRQALGHPMLTEVPSA
jgi:glycyl-tRNA synthetase alpha chain